VRVDRPGDPGAGGGFGDDRGDPGIGQRLPGSLDGDEHRAVQRAGRAPVAQVSDDRRADVCGQRQPVTAPALAADRDLAAPPVDVVQAEPGGFAGSQAHPGQQQQDRPVPAPGGGGRVAGVQHRLDLPGLQRPGQPGQRVTGRRRHRARQRGGQDAIDVQEAEQGPQRGHDPLGRPRLLPGLGQYECPYLAGGQLLQAQVPVVFESPLLQERAGQADVQRDRRRCQAALGRQVGREPVQQQARLRRRLRRRKRGRPQPAEIAQQRAECLGGPLVRVSRQAAGREVPFRRRHVQILGADALGGHPAAQVSGQPYLAGCSERGIAEPEQLGPEPVRVLRERPGHLRPGRFRFRHHELLIRTTSASGEKNQPLTWQDADVIPLMSWDYADSPGLPARPVAHSQRLVGITALSV
jgi:hypothetical protein